MVSVDSRPWLRISYDQDNNVLLILIQFVSRRYALFEQNVLLCWMPRQKKLADMSLLSFIKIIVISPVVMSLQISWFYLPTTSIYIDYIPSDGVDRRWSPGSNSEPGRQGSDQQIPPVGRVPKSSEACEEAQKNFFEV